MKTTSSRFWLIMLLLLTYTSQVFALGARPACCPKAMAPSGMAHVPALESSISASLHTHCQLNDESDVMKEHIPLAASDCDTAPAMHADCSGEGHCHCPLAMGFSAMPAPLWSSVLVITSPPLGTHLLQLPLSYSASLYRPPIVV